MQIVWHVNGIEQNTRQLPNELFVRGSLVPDISIIEEGAILEICWKTSIRNTLLVCDSCDGLLLLEGIYRRLILVRKGRRSVDVKTYLFGETGKHNSLCP
jgi:hypothetical protein